MSGLLISEYLGQSGTDHAVLKVATGTADLGRIIPGNCDHM